MVWNVPTLVERSANESRRWKTANYWTLKTEESLGLNNVEKYGGRRNR